MAALEKQKYMLYNNMMYTVASHLVEVKTGRPFEDFLREKFFRPLGMASAHLHPPSTQGSRDHMASGHQFDKASGNWSVFDIPYAPEAQGAGSIVTSTADYIKWVQAMLHRHVPISEASKKLSRNQKFSSTLKTKSWILSAHTSFTAWAGKLTTTVAIKS
jgi:CubicO group peptidase (beta-lactamase class C family)